MIRTFAALTLAAAPALAEDAAGAEPDYFTATPGLSMERDDRGVLTVTFGEDGRGLVFTAGHHTAFTRAFYEIGQDRENKVVILTGGPEGTITGIDFASFGDVSDPDVWSRVHDEGVQILENLVNIRVPVLAALEGETNVHSEYFLTANLVVAGEGTSFDDLPHFDGGIVPGDGIYQAWSHLAGPGRAQAFLLDPEPLPAETAHAWGVVSEVVPEGEALARAQEIAQAMVAERPALTLRNTRLHFTQPLKERLVREVGYGLSLEGASAGALVKSLSQPSQ